MGISFSDYDEMTPYQLNLAVEAYNQRIKQEQDDKISIAYMQAYWTIQWLGKNKPDPLNKILGIEKVQKQMTPEQILEQAKKMNAAIGGTSY